MSHQRIDYNAIDIKWQKRWDQAGIFQVDPDPERKKVFVTFPFAYMNGPLHVGHGFTAAKVDAYARYMRMRQFNVLFPWAWHWTGETIAGASERLRMNDPAIVREFKEIDGVPEEELAKFSEPVNIARYYTLQNKETVKKIGFTIDWRREFHTTSLEPAFNRFVEWQYKKLQEGNYVFMGTHPVVWCPHCESPTGDHDRLEGEGVASEEYILVKFRLDDAYLVAATFRPETIYAVTNLWLNPDADYVKVQVDGERWIISPEAAEKLREQLKSIEIIERFKGSKLISRECQDLIAKRSLPILPGWFVNPANGSGVVYSVPAHAPFDWVALRDLKAKPELAEKYGVSRSQLDAIEPVSMISVEGHGEFPAIEIVDQLGVKDQNDPKCDEATKIIYKREFHTGSLKSNCGKYSGMKIREIKDIIVKDFKEAGIVDSMYDLPERVVCRCTTYCRVKILQGQWFLRYSDAAWKDKTKALISQAKIFPESARQWFLDVVDWYRDWPCARKTGLGTPLPWSPEWIVETLSDSTVYMAFYTVNKDIRRLNLNPQQLTDQVFDYIFLGEGEVEAVAEKSGIPSDTLTAMREEFLYWYPVDLRVSAKELLPNHLTFFLFQHAALFEKRHWPKGVGVNGMLMIEGLKMSKSKGNIVTLRKAIEGYGADVTRCVLLLGADDMDDPDWRMENLRDITLKLDSFMNLSRQIIESKENQRSDHLDDWLISRLHDRIKKVSENMECLRTRAAAENVIYEIPNDIRWYLRRKKTLNKESASSVLRVWVRLMAPFAPHLAEEIWEQLGESNFVSQAEWPRLEDYNQNIKSELTEEMIQRTLEDINSIIKVTGKTPAKVTLYSASDWKWKATLKLLTQGEGASSETKEIMKELASDPSMKEMMKEAAKYIQTVTKEITQTSEEIRQRLLKAGTVDEFTCLEGAVQFFSRELKAEVKVFREDDPSRVDPKGRSHLAKPYRPAIYIE